MVYPEYYPRFRCIADACRHTCCQGWEIDVDDKTAAAIITYLSETGTPHDGVMAFEDGTFHFCLDAHERCPFLNARNLCELILSERADLLPEICNEHPRFYNRIGERCEAGLGLCCEAAARLILGWKEPVRLLERERKDAEPEIGARDAMIAQLQDRSLSLDDRLRAVVGDTAWHFDGREWCERLLRLEIMDDAWRVLLQQLLQAVDGLPIHEFCAYMRERVCEYEQLAVYFVYRHALNESHDSPLWVFGRLAAWGVMLIGSLGAMLWQQRGEFSFADQVELARLVSAEIEYSEENMDEVLYYLEENS